MKGIRNFGTILVIASLITSLGLIGCAQSEDPIQCQADSCTPNGSCVIVDDDAVCECDPGYKQGEGLTCIPDGDGKVGEICTGDADCASGRCLKYSGDTEGYCTTTNCATDGECINNAVGETAEMCCVEVDAAYFICMKIADGYACGTGDGTCGTSCTGTIDSACGLEFPCLRTMDTDPGAICSAPCAVDADCSACEWTVNPDASIECITISGGDKYCLVNDVIECNSFMDCPEGQSCTIGVSADFTDLYGECGTYGALEPGAECNPDDDVGELDFDERCSALYCFGGMCTEVCQVNTDCPDGMSCDILQFSDVEDTINVCMKEMVSCDSHVDCPEGETCSIGVSGDMTDLFGECYNWGALPPGSECDPDADINELSFDERCSGLYCFGGMCTEVCQVTADCPEGMLCDVLQFSDVDDTINVCMKAQPPCDTTADCADGLTCSIGVSGDMTDLFGECYDWGALPPGSECDPSADINELSFDERCSGLYCFGGMCTEVCQVTADCPEGMSCDLLQFSDVEDTITVCMKILAPCDTTADCSDGDTCTIGVNSDLTDLFGECNTYGDLPPGSACDQFADTSELPFEERCSAAYCFDNACIEVCTVEGGCPTGMACEPFTFSDVDDSIDICMKILDPCASAADCPATETCTIGVNSELTDLFGECNTFGELEPGAVCDANADPFEISFDQRCSALYCMGGMCTEVCTETADCPTGMACEPFTFSDVDDSIDICQPAA